MARYRVAYRFGTTVQANGQATFVAFNADDVVDVEDWLAAELAVQVPGALAPVLDTKPGLTDEASTRAVSAPAAKKKKPTK